MGQQASVEVWLVDNDPYWKAVWKDPDAPSGQRSKSLGSKAKFSRRQARVLCRELGADLASKAKLPNKAPHLFAWLTRYEQLRTDVKETTRKTYRECFAYLRVYFDNDPTIDRISRGDAADWTGAMQSGELTQALNAIERSNADASGERLRFKWRTPALATVRRHVRTAKMVFQQAADEDRILFNPFDRLKGSPPKPLKEWREVTPADMLRIFESCPSDAWRNLFALCRYGALRLNEALTLMWIDVDWSGNRMKVNERIRSESTKQRFRVCPLDPARCPTGLAKRLRDAFEAAPAGSTFVCEGVDRNNVRRIALRILRTSGVGEYARPFHTLRKNRVSELAVQYPQGVVMEWCGHDEEVSRRHYQRVPEEMYALAPIQNGRSQASEPRPVDAPSAHPS